MGKARGEGARKFVVYSDPLKPLDFGGWPIEQAFDALLKQCGYAADWDVTEIAVLRLRHADGPHKGVPVGVHRRRRVAIPRIGRQSSRVGIMPQTPCRDVT